MLRCGQTTRRTRRSDATVTGRTVTRTAWQNTVTRTIAILAIALLVAVAAVRTAWLSAAREDSPARPKPGPRFVTFVEKIMTAPIRVTVPADAGRPAAERVFEIFRRVDARMSEWKPTSPLSQVNANAGIRPVPVPADLRAVLHRGIEIGRRTGGAFDITWAALWGLWDFKSPEPRVPDADEIAARVRRIDYRRVRIDDKAGTVYLPEKGMLLGLGGIAKGYALDQAARALRAMGVRDFLLSAGGQVYAGGTRAGRPWRVGIRDPRGRPGDYFATLEIRDASLATSGDYERYFERDGVRYHHVLDPRTGMPARGVRSVTVISPDATLADALSTALMVLGVERGLDVAASYENVEAVFVDDAGAVHTTPGISSKLTRLHDPEP